MELEMDCLISRMPLQKSLASNTSSALKYVHQLGNI